MNEDKLQQILHLSSIRAKWSTTCPNLKRGPQGTNLIEGWVDPAAGMATFENRKISCPARHQSKIPQYTDRITLAPPSSIEEINMYI